MQRTFTIGDDWLYFKIFSGIKTADSLLSEVISPVTQKLLAENKISKWFFIRYSDPKFHLRVRFLQCSSACTNDIIAAINTGLQPFIATGLSWKIQTDTYQREIERYGVKTIEPAESLFFHDSEMITKMLALIEGDEGEIIRWLFALRATDELLNDFHYNLNQKNDLLNILQENFGKEFNMNKQLEIQLGDKFRKERNAISEVLDRSKDSESEMLPIFELLNQKSLSILPIVNSILDTIQESENTIRLNDLLPSYIHMMLNRIFRSNQRLHELVIYSLLHRYYRAETGRLNSARKNQLKQKIN